MKLLFKKCVYVCFLLCVASSELVLHYMVKLLCFFKQYLYYRTWQWNKQQGGVKCTLNQQQSINTGKWGKKQTVCLSACKTEVLAHATISLHASVTASGLPQPLYACSMCSILMIKLADTALCSRQPSSNSIKYAVQTP